MERSSQTRRRVLFLCTANSCRSQMAEALTNHLGGDAWQAYSAGTNPRPVHPLTYRVMEDLDIDLADQRPKEVDEFQAEAFDLVITVCDDAREACPKPPPAPVHRHWSLPDPAAATGSDMERLAAFRRVRDDLRARIEKLLAEQGN